MRTDLSAVVEKLLSVVFRCHEAEAALRSLPKVAGVAELKVGVQREDLVLGELELEADVGLQQWCQCHRAYTRPHLHPGTHLDLLAVLHAQCHRRGAPARREVDGGDLLGQAVEVPRDTDEVATGASDLRHGVAWLAVQVVAAPTKQSQGSAGRTSVSISPLMVLYPMPYSSNMTRSKLSASMGAKTMVSTHTTIHTQMCPLRSSYWSPTNGFA